MKTGVVMAVLACSGVGSNLARAERSHNPEGWVSPHRSLWALGLGVRTGWMGARALELFGDTGSLVQVSASATGLVWSEAPYSLAVVGLWDYGEVSGGTRGNKAKLAVHRLEVGAELRYALLARVSAYGRVAIGTVGAFAVLDDPVLEAQRRGGSWAAAIDPALGLWIQLVPRGNPRSVGFGAYVEGGYGWDAGRSLVLASSADSSVFGYVPPLDRERLALRAPFARVGLALSF